MSNQMSSYVDRKGQRIGPWVVVKDVGRSKQGKVIWKLRNTENGRDKHMRTGAVIQLAIKHGAPKPANSRNDGCAA